MDRRNALMDYYTTADVLNTPINRGGVLPLTEYADRAEWDMSSGLPGMIGQALTAPGRAYRGEIAPDQEVPEAMNLAGLLTLGGYMSPKPANALGVSGGRAAGIAGIPEAAVFPSDAVLPSQTPFARSASDQRGRKGFNLHQQGRDDHSLMTNVSSLDNIVQTYGLSPDGAMTRQLAEIIENPGPYYYGVRTAPYRIDADSVMPDSVQWYQDASPIPFTELTKHERNLIREAPEWSGLSDDVLKDMEFDPTFLDHGAPLGGASAIGILDPRRDIPQNIAEIARGYSSYGAEGDFVHLVRSKHAHHGYDQGEIVMGNPEVISVAPYGNNLFSNGRNSLAPGAVMTEAAKRAEPQGIKGIRYLDQGSRGAGEGSSNYVVFDDSLIEILRKYGLLGPVAAGTLATATSDGEVY